jgi:hypothetical protein
MPTIDDQIQEARLREARAQADLAELRLQQERMTSTVMLDPDAFVVVGAPCMVCSLETAGHVDAMTLTIGTGERRRQHSLHHRCWIELQHATESA